MKLLGGNSATEIMSVRDPFGPLSRKRRIFYTVACAGVMVGVAILLGSMEGGYPAWKLLGVSLLVGIPAFLILGLFAWLSGGPRTNANERRSNREIPPRMAKAMPFIIIGIGLVYLIKLIGLLFGGN